MRKNILAICDLESTYCKRLSTYLSTHGFHQFTVMTFSSMDKLEAVLETQDLQIEILLLAESAFRESEILDKVTKVILLREEGRQILSNIPVVNKYQSIPDLMKEVNQLYAQDERCSGGILTNTVKTKIIGFYTPKEDDIAHISAVLFALFMAEQKKVLYLNLSAYTSFSDWFYEEEGEIAYDLGDLIYFLKQNEEKALYKIDAMKHTYQNLDYILPISYPNDLNQVPKEEWCKLLNCICTRSEYQAVILDFGETVDGLYELLEECDYLVTPISRNPFVRSRIKLFTQMCRQKGLESILEKIRQVELDINVNEIKLPVINMKTEYLGNRMKELVIHYANDVI